MLPTEVPQPSTAAPPERDPTAAAPAADAAEARARAATTPPPEPAPASIPSSPTAATPDTQADRTERATPNPPALDPAEQARAERLLARGERDMANGNVAQARLFFLHAAKAGLARGALLLGATYDVNQLAKMSAVGIQPNADLARHWYQRARELGAGEADARLSALSALGTAGPKR
jgi:hypothetical protein